MASPVRVNTGAGGSIHNSDPISFNVNVGTGSNRCVFITLVVLSSTTTDSITVTVGGVSCGSPIHTGTAEDSCKMYTWKLTSTDGLGTGSLAVQINGSDSSWRGAARAVPYEDVDQTTPHGTVSTTANGTSTSPATNAITVGAGDLVYLALGFRESTNITARGTGQSEIGTNESNSGASGGLQVTIDEGTADNVGDWTIGAAQGWNAWGFAVKGVSAGGSALKRLIGGNLINRSILFGRLA